MLGKRHGSGPRLTASSGGVSCGWEGLIHGGLVGSGPRVRRSHLQGLTFSSYYQFACF